MRNGLRLGLASSLAALWLIASASPAAASETIGRLAPTPSTSCVGTTFDFIQPTVTTGTGYVVPALPNVNAMVISSWSHNAAPAPASGALTFKVFRKVADPATYMVVGHDGPRDLTAGALNTFPAKIPVQPGDVIGINSAVPAATACTFFDMTETPLARSGSLADGESGAFSALDEKDVNVSAVVSPSNDFTLGTAKLKKKKGNATLAAMVPNPGEVDLAGTGIKPATIASAPGGVTLLVKATGSKRKKLAKKGVAKVNPTITYTPTGGEASTQTMKLKLRLVS
jgi:hypothetical protein